MVHRKVAAKPRVLLTSNAVFNRLMSHHQSINNVEGPFTRAGIAGSSLGGFLGSSMTRIDKECQYPDILTIADFRTAYNRNGLAKRVNDVWPDECFNTQALIYESPDDKTTNFERAWKNLSKTIPWHSIWHRLDRCAGIGRYGVLMLGLKGDTDKDAFKVKNQELRYAMPFAEDNCFLSSQELDTNSNRFRQPLMYGINFQDPIMTASKQYHWSRILHYVDNRESSELFHLPRMQQSFNYILDAKKISGSSAEMFYKGAFQGWAYQAFPELTGEGDLDAESVREQITAYQEGLQRFLAVVGGEIKTLAPAISDPTNHLTQQIILICLTLSIPLRIFMGSEAGHLASTQDSGNWNKRVRQRQELIVTPYMIRATIDRLILLGVLPAPASGEYFVEWSDLNTISDTDMANIGLKKTQSLMSYVTGKVYYFLSFKKYLTLILGIPEPEAKAAFQEVGGQAGIDKAIKTMEKIEMKPAAPTGGQTKGKSKGADRNRPAKKTPKG